MTYEELKTAQKELGLTIEKMAKLLRVGLPTYKGWGVRKKVPDYIAASVEAHLLLSKDNIKKLLDNRLT